MWAPLPSQTVLGLKTVLDGGYYRLVTRTGPRSLLCSTAWVWAKYNTALDQRVGWKRVETWDGSLDVGCGTGMC